MKPLHEFLRSIVKLAPYSLFQLIYFFFLPTLQFEPDESDEKSMLLIWDFEVDHILSQRANPQEPIFPSETRPEAPLLDVKKLSVDCNCCKFPQTSGIFFDRDEESENENSQGEGDLEGLDIDTESSIQNLYPDSHRDDLTQDSDDESDEESVQHKLGFKCIGAAHEKPRQEYLRKAETKLHKEQVPVIVRLRPEPTNEKDSNAIAIDMNCGTGWNCVGYIARELTEYLHLLINNGKILSVSVEHIIFRLYWAKIGYYPLINITRKGQWERYVMCRCRSAR